MIAALHAAGIGVVDVYKRQGDGGAVLGTKPLVRGAQGVWSIWLPGEQHGRYYTFAVTCLLYTSASQTRNRQR